MGDVIVPLVGDPNGVVFQCPPTLRVVLPSARATGKLHKDSDYPGHEASEINFWLPLTQVWGNNTLQLESAPDQGDFHPLELGYGEFVRFNGAYCRHHTLPNATDSTRVSLDFRVIPRRFWLNSHGCK